MEEKKQNQERFIDRARALRDAFVAAELESGGPGLEEVINSDKAIEAYPFKFSFDEMSGYIEAWIETLEAGRRHSHDEICHSVIDWLEAAGISATYEFPGFIRTVGLKGDILAFGTDGWCGQIWAREEDEETDGPCRLVNFGLEAEEDRPAIIGARVIRVLAILDCQRAAGEYCDKQIEIKS